MAVKQHIIGAAVRLLAEFRQIRRLLAHGSPGPVVHQEFPPAQAPPAHEALDDPCRIGKILIP